MSKEAFHNWFFNQVKDKKIRDIKWAKTGAGHSYFIPRRLLKTAVGTMEGELYNADDQLISSECHASILKGFTYDSSRNCRWEYVDEADAPTAVPPEPQCTSKCDCGAKCTPNPNLHAPWCTEYKGD